MFELHNDLALKEPRNVIEQVASYMSDYQKWQARDADRRQERLNKERGVVKIRKDAVCVPTLNIEPYVYHRLGQQFGYDCWEDPDFVDYVQRHMPVRVKAQSETPTFGVEFGASKLATRKEPKFSKNYGQI